jgi:hypothetical protein
VQCPKCKQVELVDGILDEQLGVQYCNELGHKLAERVFELADLVKHTLMEILALPTSCAKLPLIRNPRSAVSRPLAINVPDPSPTLPLLRGGGKISSLPPY